MEEVVFLSLGSNLGSSKETLLLAFQDISGWVEVKKIERSDFYRTSPVSPLIQPDFINVVFKLTVETNIFSFWHKIEDLERRLGKISKNKEEPRFIDIDLLFFGQKRYSGEALVVPHPRWNQRLFVLCPLLDLVSYIFMPEGEKVEIAPLIDKLKTETSQKVMRIA